MKKTFISLFLLLLSGSLYAQDSTITYKPKVLLVTAHPDDDALFSASVFKITRLMDGVVDLALMTNGEGGYKYSTLGNYIYGKDLDKEKTGREYLPGIRKKELMAGGDIVGIRNYFFFDQEDFYYTLDVREALDKWDTEWIIQRLEKIISEGDYDFMFLMLPFEGTHGHHKASAVLALRALNNLPEDQRPVALENFIRRGPDDPGVPFTMLEGFPLTKVKPGITFEFDRNQTFGFDDRLNYNIIANWVIAEHKSQGTMQLLMSTGVIEQYWYVDINKDQDIEKTRRFFNAINKVNIYEPIE
ncbi:PIG-L family deacetylase [Balneola sp. MJW-20]|uniref:PIG-L family deacetylase n=1 Tax=Gracilimonas aurantiaca TaxID=3234185 RepID=UPI003465461B